MPVRVVILHARAGGELREAYRWYARRSPVTAQRLQAAVGDVMQRIASGAERGAPYRRRYRWMPLRPFPYLVYYEIRDPAPVLVYTFAHVRRRPGYWLRRARP